MEELAADAPARLAGGPSDHTMLYLLSFFTPIFIQMRRHSYM